MKIGNKELRITPASFDDAMALQKAVGRSLQGSKLELPGSIDEEMSTDTLSDVINMVLSVAVDDDVEAALFKCCERALVGDEKINRDYFEDADNRQHFYPIMIEILKVNLAPFFKNLLSSFGVTGKKIIASLKSK